MSSLLKSDIFFMISGVSVIIITTVLIVVLVMIGRAAREIRVLAETARKEMEELHEKNFSLLRQSLFFGSIIRTVVNKAVKRRRFF